MFVAMGDQLYPSQYERMPNYDGFTPQSAVCDFYHSSLSDDSKNLRLLLYSQYDQVSSFNMPLIYDSALTTPVSLGAESPVLAAKAPSSSLHWGRDQSQMNYPMRDSRAIFTQNPNNRMKSNAKDPPLSLQVPQVSNDGIGLGFPPYVFDSPQNLCPPTPYWGSFGVSGPQVASPTPSLPSNSHSASQLSAASTPSMTHNIPISQNNTAPILVTPTPGQLRTGKRTHESPGKPEQHTMQFPHRPLPQQQQHTQSPNQFAQSPNQFAQSPNQFAQSPNHFNQSPNQYPPSLKRESPPLQSQQKRRKPSDPATPMLNQNQRLPSTDSTPGSSGQGNPNQPRYAPLGNRPVHAVVSEEEEFLLYLRDVRDPKPDWKKTMIEFNEKMGKNYRIPALQMRYSRLKERLRIWTEKDVSAAAFSISNSADAVAHTAYGGAQRRQL